MLKSLARAQRPGRQLALLLIAGWSLRLILALLAEHPGLFDPNHYHNLARSLAAGRGFVIDYIWQYHQAPADLTHPIDYWMPLAAVWPALSMAVFGPSLLAALLPSTIISTSLSALAWGIARVARLSPASQLTAAALVLFIPEFMLGSVRTDTPISYALWVGLALLCFSEGMRRRPPLLVLSGIFAGLAWLTRLDGILLLPALALAIGLWRRFGKRSIPWRWVALMFLSLAIIVTPWLWRNQMLYGQLLPSGPTFFKTHFNDEYTYNREINLDHYLDWGWRNILGNIAFHALSNIKQAYTSLDIALPALAFLGLCGLAWRRARDHWLLLAAPIAFFFTLYLFYTVFAPFHSMGGSFKKSQLALIPWLALPATWALENYLRPRAAAHTLAVIIVIFMALNGVEFVRQEMKVVQTYLAPYRQLRDTLNTLGDANDDGRITVMGEDPWILNYLGFYALVTPFDERDSILAAARHYQADYLILPAHRPSLDTLYSGEEMDTRLAPVAKSAHFSILQATADIQP